MSAFLRGVRMLMFTICATTRRQVCWAASVQLRVYMVTYLIFVYECRRSTEAAAGHFRSYTRCHPFPSRDCCQAALSCSVAISFATIKPRTQYVRDLPKLV